MFLCHLTGASVLNRILTQIVQTSLDAIRIIDIDKNIIDINDAFVQLVGLPRQNIIGK